MGVEYARPGQAAQRLFHTTLAEEERIRDDNERRGPPEKPGKRKPRQPKRKRQR